MKSIPTPVAITNDGRTIRDGHGVLLCVNGGSGIGEISACMADIVLAVNCHDELVAACRGLLAATGEYDTACVEFPEESNCGECDACVFRKAWTAACAALAKVGGKP